MGKEPGPYRPRPRWETCCGSPRQLVSEGQKCSCHPGLTAKVVLHQEQTRFHPSHLAASARSLASCIQRSCLGRQLTALTLFAVSQGTNPAHPISPVYVGNQSKERQRVSSQKEGPGLISRLFIHQVTACDNFLQAYPQLKAASKLPSSSSKSKPT